jgi:hypothetical protein
MQRPIEFNFKNLKGREHLEFESMDGKIILKCVIVKILDIFHRTVFYLKREV